MLVTGQVIDPHGVAVPNARVLVVTKEYARNARPTGVYITNSLPFVYRYHGPQPTDDKGCFRLEVSHSRIGPYLEAGIYAVANGHGVVTSELDALADSQQVELQLDEEHVARGRLIDLNGQPVVGATVRLYHYGSRMPQDVLSIWKSVTTDDHGRFLIRGLSHEKIHLEIQHEQFASHREEFQPILLTSDEKTAIALSPAHKLVGRVTYADTGKPAAGALVIVPAAEVGDGRWVQTRTDENGNYSVNPFVPDRRATFGRSDVYYVNVFAPKGAHYLASRHRVDANRAAQQTVDVKLQRGVLVRGTITEASTGSPVAGARVQFSPNQDNNPFLQERYLGAAIEPSRLQTTLSDEQGRFLLPVLPGKGHLYVLGPTLDYVPVMRESTWLSHREYAAAIVRLELDANAEEHEVDIQLTRGITLHARVVGTDGQPVPEFVVVSRSYIASGYEPQDNLRGRDGQFELPGCDPDEVHTVVVYDKNSRCGATAELTKANADTPATIRLQPCAAGRATIVDKDGQPIADYHPRLSIVLSPGGPNRLYSGRRGRDWGIEADLREMQILDGEAYNRRAFVTDDDGQVELPVLIPGAKHMFDWPPGNPVEPAPWPHVTFTVKSGEEKDLGKITHEYYSR